MNNIFAWKGKGLDQDGTNDADGIYGGNGVNHFFGFGGDDYLVGGNGNDVLNGGDGNDTLFGGSDADTLTLGAGADVVYIGPHWDSQNVPGQTDVVTDFNVAEDKVDMSKVCSGALTSLAQFEFVSMNDGEDTKVIAHPGGLASNDVALDLLGVAAAELTADNFILA